MHPAKEVFYSIQDFLFRIDDYVLGKMEKGSDWLGVKLFEPSLEQTLVLKNGKGPHGYGDPRDAYVREEEYYLFPRMIWKKIRYEKCYDVSNKFFSCIARQQKGEDVDCTKEQEAMYSCKNQYYTPENLTTVERECIVEYVQLRSKFRETGSEDDLWQLKMLMLSPTYNQVYLAYKGGASAEELKKLLPRQLEPATSMDL